jgi:hypothetical protein
MKNGSICGIKKTLKKKRQKIEQFNSRAYRKWAAKNGVKADKQHREFIEREAEQQHRELFAQLEKGGGK